MSLGWRCVCVALPAALAWICQAGGGPAMTITVTSQAFQDGGLMPPQYSGWGDNHSPPLAWTGVPEGTKTLALICDDPDAPGGSWVHWVLWNLAASSKGLDAALPGEERLPDGVCQGRNDFGQIGYGGPTPPSGIHRYVFTVYALDTELRLTGAVSRRTLEEAMKGHIMAQGRLVGRFAARRR